MSDSLLMLLEMIEEVLEEQKAPRVNRGELVEELIVIETGGATDYFNPPTKPNLQKKRTPESKQKAIDKYNKDRAKHREKLRLQGALAGDINASVSKTQEIKGKKLEKLGTQKLPAEGVYAKFGVKSGIPKTDLIDPKRAPKYSVKDEAGAQFISAQGPESAALWYVSLNQAAGGKDFSSAVTNALDKVPQDIKDYFAPKNFVQIKRSGKKNLQVHLQKIYDQIFNDILVAIGVTQKDFMLQFYIEGMTGKVKFDNGEGSADKMLSWNTKGDPFKIENIIDFVTNAPKGQLKVRVSDRGHERGGTIRGDIKKIKTLEEELPSAAAQKMVQNIPTAEPEQTSYSEEQIENLGNYIKEKLFNIYNRRGKEVGLVDLLDYLKTQDERGDVDMKGLYEVFGIQTTAEEYTPAKGYNNRMLEGI